MTAAPRIADATLDAIKSRVDVVAIVGRYVELHGVGNDQVGLCPFHTERTPSFTVTPSKGLWHCFGCDASGDVVSFLERIEHKSFLQVIKELAVEAGVDIHEAPPTPRPPTATPPAREAWAPSIATPVDRWRTIYTPGDAHQTWARLSAPLAPCHACAACVDGVGDCVEIRPDNAARTWLAEARKIPFAARLESGIVTAASWNLSAWPQVIVDEEKGTTARQWVAGLMRANGLAAAVPLRDAVTGMEDGLRLRFLTPKDDKWKKPINIKGLSSHAADGTPRGYGFAGASLRSPLLVLCEGMVDTLTAEALEGGRPDITAVGAADEGELRRRWAPHLSHRKHGAVVILAHLDRPADDKHATPTADGSGQNAAREARAALVAAGVTASVFRWGTFLQCLTQAGVPGSVVEHDIKDLNDAARVCDANGVAWDTLRAIFLYSLLEATHD